MNPAVDAVVRLLDQGGDADDLLRAVVASLVADGGCAWAGILFAEGGELILGPYAGMPAPDERQTAPVEFQGVSVAELAADGAPRGLLTSVATLIAPYCLVGWDTGGVPWDDATSA